MSSKQAQAKSAYRDDGYFLVTACAAIDLLSPAVEGMDDIRGCRYETGRSPHTSPWESGRRSKCALQNRAAAAREPVRAGTCKSSFDRERWAAAVTGAKVVQVWWIQLLYKPPAAQPTDGLTNVGWHQDRQYWEPGRKKASW